MEAPTGMCGGSYGGWCPEKFKHCDETLESREITLFRATIFKR